MDPASTRRATGAEARRNGLKSYVPFNLAALKSYVPFNLAHLPMFDGSFVHWYD